MAKMLKVAIAADNWKLPGFRTNLKQAGYERKECPFTDETTIMQVRTDDIEALYRVVRTCEAQAQREKQDRAKTRKRNERKKKKGKG